MSSPSVPSTVPSHDISFPPQGLLGFGFPCFLGTTKCSDAPSPVSIRFVFLRSSIPFTHSRFAPDDGECRADGPGAFASRAAFPVRLHLEGKRSGLPRSWGTRCAYALLSDPGGTERVRPLRRARATPVHTTTKAPHEYCLSGLNHTAWALAVYASPRGSPHHDARLASGCWPSSTARALPARRVPSKGFSYNIASSFPKLRGARCVTESADP